MFDNDVSVSFSANFHSDILSKYNIITCHNDPFSSAFAHFPDQLDSDWCVGPSDEDALCFQAMHTLALFAFSKDYFNVLDGVKFFQKQKILKLFNTDFNSFLPHTHTLFVVILVKRRFTELVNAKHMKKVKKSSLWYNFSKSYSSEKVKCIFLQEYGESIGKSCKKSKLLSLIIIIVCT